MKTTVGPILMVILVIKSLAASAQDYQHIREQEFAIADSMIPGTMFTRITEGENKLPYHVYVPSNYSPETPPPPIIIAFHSGGDGLKIGGKMQPGVDESGWLLVACDKLRNGTSDSLGLVWEDEIIPDILKNIPHDSLRIYLAGFSGGALRAYELTTRRPEKYAGVIAFGGWLGGYYTYPKLYRHGMTVAQVNGAKDVGAGYWTEIDAEVLRKHYCSVRHFSHSGGHKIAPPEVTGRVIRWLQGEWIKKENVEGLGISPSLWLPAGRNQMLSVFIAPGYDMKEGLSWKSDDNSVVKVDDSGVISGISTGKARVIASTNDGRFSDTCTVSVFIKVSGVSINKQYITLSSIGATKGLIATVSPPDATDKSVSWNSNDTSIAVVDEQGTVTSVGTGSTIIQVKTNDIGHSASCHVTVYIELTGVSLDTSEISMDSIGATHVLKAIVSPSDAWNKTVRWSSDDHTVAIVNNTGTVTAVGPGKTSINVETNAQGYKASCEVIVTLPSGNIDLVSHDNIAVYPNPFSREIRIFLPENHQYFALQFIDISGKILFSERIKNSTKMLLLSNKEIVSAKPGVYSIRLSGAESCESFKIIKVQ